MFVYHKNVLYLSQNDECNVATSFELIKFQFNFRGRTITIPLTLMIVRSLMASPSNMRGLVIILVITDLRAANDKPKVQIIPGMPNASTPPRSTPGRWALPKISLKRDTSSLSNPSQFSFRRPRQLPY